MLQAWVLLASSSKATLTRATWSNPQFLRTERCTKESRRKARVLGSQWPARCIPQQLRAPSSTRLVLRCNANAKAEINSSPRPLSHEPIKSHTGCTCACVCRCKSSFITQLEPFRRTPAILTGRIFFQDKVNECGQAGCSKIREQKSENRIHGSKLKGLFLCNFFLWRVVLEIKAIEVQATMRSSARSCAPSSARPRCLTRR